VVRVGGAGAGGVPGECGTRGSEGKIVTAEGLTAFNRDLESDLGAGALCFAGLFPGLASGEAGGDQSSAFPIKSNINLIND
jgi:hypothetical protein